VVTVTKLLYFVIKIRIRRRRPSQISSDHLVTTTRGASWDGIEIVLELVLGSPPPHVP
jgi:hypothetical protein